MDRVLIVEDDPAIYYTLEIFLKDKGLDVTIAVSLKDAEYHLNSNAFDLILLDRNLPDGLGDNLLHHIRQDMQQQTPVIIMSASLQGKTVRHLMDTGANDYVLKPFPLKEMLQLIQHWLKRHVAH